MTLCFRHMAGTAVDLARSIKPDPHLPASQQRWFYVAEALGVGPTVAKCLCRAADVDPNEILAALTEDSAA